MPVFGSYYLICFVALSGEQNHRSVRCQSYRCPYGLFSVRYEQCLDKSFAAESFTDIFQNVLSVLRPAVVGSDENSVRIFFRHCRHFRTFRLVPVSAASEKTDDVALRSDVAQCLQHILQRVRRMRVIYRHRNPARSPQSLQTAFGRFEFA